MPCSAREQEQADLAGARHVRAAAELLREAGHLDDAHPLAVLVAEEGEGTVGERLLAAHDLGLEPGVAQDLAVDAVLDVAQLARADGRRSG